MNPENYRIKDDVIVEVDIEVGRILLFVIVLERMSGFDRLYIFSLKGWIVFCYIEEILSP